MSAPAVLSVDPRADWMRDAEHAISALVTGYHRTGQTFTADDLRGIVGQPDDIHWPGTAFKVAHARGEIEPTGQYVRSTRRARKGSILAVWKAATP